jgi:hypothetical protein
MIYFVYLFMGYSWKTGQGGQLQIIINFIKWICS